MRPSPLREPLLRQSPQRLTRDDKGGVIVEYSLVIWLFIMLTAGAVEFGLALFQWQSASKAVQAGARIAAVSAPVSSDVKTLTGLSSGIAPGDPMPSFVRVCNGASASCSNGGTYDAAAMSTILFGRGENACGGVAAEQLPAMCDMFRRVAASNVRITYEQTGLGFAGRPGGPVPTITVELTGLTFNFVFLSGILGPVTIPPMRTTVTGEDLSTTMN